MSTELVDYIDAIAHLPAGATLRLSSVSWEEYEMLLSDLTDWPGMRVSYDAGEMKVMSPSPEHEDYKDFVYSLARVISEESNIILETRGATTFRQKRKAKGAEPDTCFYVQNAARVIGKRKIDLDIDPPPDVVVGIDLTNESLGKFNIYAAFGVPEIWRYDGEHAYIYQLTGQTYAETNDSLAFPSLTAAALTDFIAQSKTQGQTAALIAFRQWWRSHSSSAS
ncbi:MAG TPA: Uma2 family endonuclease [Pyrinomonadaceae bacterium]